MIAEGFQSGTHQSNQSINPHAVLHHTAGNPPGVYCTRAGPGCLTSTTQPWHCWDTLVSQMRHWQLGVLSAVHPALLLTGMKCTAH